MLAGVQRHPSAVALLAKGFKGSGFHSGFLHLVDTTPLHSTLFYSTPPDPRRMYDKLADSSETHLSHPPKLGSLTSYHHTWVLGEVLISLISDKRLARPAYPTSEMENGS